MNQLTVYFIRHGTTTMNLQGRFCGRTDALLDPQGWDELRQLKEDYEIPDVERVYSSPAIRCQETASVYFPDKEPFLKEGLWECDFGKGEKTPASDYAGTDFFKDWLKQLPDTAFPEGESLIEVSFRALSAMTRIVYECRRDGISTIAVVAHGCILGRLMEVSLNPRKYAAEFTLSPNGMGLIGTLDMDEWFYKQEIIFEKYFPEGAPRLKAEDSPYFAND